MAVSVPVTLALCADASGARAQPASVRIAAADDLPRDVAIFLRRRAGCNRLFQEDGRDPERVEASVRSRFRMKCNTLDDDEGRLRARYAADLEIIGILDLPDGSEE